VSSGGGDRCLSILRDQTLDYSVPRVVAFAGLLTALILVSGCNSASQAQPSVVVLPVAALVEAGASVQFAATSSGAPVAATDWLVDNVPGGGARIGTITSSGLYTAPVSAPPRLVNISASDSTNREHSLSAQVSIFDPNKPPSGTVTSTANPLVANFALVAPIGASVQVQFGTTTSYGLITSAQPAPANGGGVHILVAGMRASTTYHMRAVVHLSNGTIATAADQVFTTGEIPVDLLPNIAVKQTPGMTPASGVEMLCLFPDPSSISTTTPPSSSITLTSVVTDLQGNVIWYDPIQPHSPYPMKPLPNGHFLVVVNGLNEVREIDLAGNIVFRLLLTDLQRQLNAQGIALPGLLSFHHDVVKLSNGHLIALVNFTQNSPDSSGIPVTGDALIDYDPAQGPVWTWSAFDHIPLSHAPWGTKDWTHANALVYSPDDGNLILSMRNQNWVVKINYQDGAGDGSILWRLGPDGDFTLPSGQAPTEWNYAQHYPTLVSPNSSGVFRLMLFNNGDNRIMNSSNQLCGTSGLPACYSSVPVFQLDEAAHTAQVVSEDNLSPIFSVCCGNADLLENGDLEYDAALYTPNISLIQEVTPGDNPQLVWQMSVTDQLAYRGFRIPSLYPGIEWTQSALATATAAAKPRKN
jgi:arylsulfate sulfotransferase